MYLNLELIGMGHKSVGFRSHMTSFVAVKMASCFLVIIGHVSSYFGGLYVPQTGLELDPVEDTGVQ